MSRQTRKQAVDWWQRQEQVRKLLENLPTDTLKQKMEKALCGIRLNRMAGARYRQRWNKPRQGDEKILAGKERNLPWEIATLHASKSSDGSSRRRPT